MSYGYGNSPTLYYPPSIADKVHAAYNRHDWRELNRLHVVWWDKYGEKWHKFGPNFWDADDEK